MIEKLIHFSCHNKFLVIAMYVGIAVYGVFVMRSTPVDAIPDLSENQVIVFTDWMGRSPKEIEDQITYPLSVNLQGLAGVKSVRSSSEFNFSMINIIFDDSVDFYFARTRVMERLALANTFLPEGVVPYLAPDSTALGQIFWYTVEGENQDPGTLRGIQDWYVRYQLNSVPGVAQVGTVGGFAKEYQIDIIPERLRAFDVTLGQIFLAVAKSNSAVGGRVVHKGNAEYLIRGVGWIRSLEDIRNIVVLERNGVPIRVEEIATVQIGSEFRRSVLEKDEREVTGGVVMMRYGENPLEVTKRIKQKIRDLQSGLPAGVSIVPFYDRTRLIEGAIHTVSTVVEHEIIIATLAIMLILTHFRSVLVVVVTVPLSILMAFIAMKWVGISSNIMSLSGIAISIGILVDQSIVMLENASHRLTDKFGDRPISGDTTDIVSAACRQVGRPIFFSVVIMVLSFLPVFTLSGQEGKLFHPLAFTKTFALIATALISITLVPAIIPLLIKGRLSKEEDNWIVRSVVGMYRPVLQFLMRRPKTVSVLFVILLGVGLFQARHLGSEFMPPLDEGSIMDMPITSPRASVTEAADDIKDRDSMIRGFPEVEIVVGKAGRADTPTDPAPLDMIETVVALRPKEHWLKRKLTMETATNEVVLIIKKFEMEGVIAPFSVSHQREDFAEGVAAASLEKFDAHMRVQITRRQEEFDNLLADQMVRFLGDRLLAQLREINAFTKPLTTSEYETFLRQLVAEHRRKFLRAPLVTDVQATIEASLKTLAQQGHINTQQDLLKPKESFWSSIAEPLQASLGIERADFHERSMDALNAFRNERILRWAKETDAALFYPAMDAFEQAVLKQLQSDATMQGFWKKDAWEKRNDQNSLSGTLALSFGDRAFLWPATKSDLVREMDSAIRQLGWSNIWTQPIINRVDMLATGVRTQIGVKVFGRSLEQIQAVSNDVAKALKGIPGAVDVVPDQTLGKGYVEVDIDRPRAARYGVNVGDIQDVIEVALGGKTITTTVEGRERYPVRMRYARDYRTDEESIKRILVSTGMRSGTSMAKASMNSSSADSPNTMGKSTGVTGSPAATQTAVYLGDVANIRVIEGPVMIKSENGLLRSYVQLNVRDRDLVGFVEEAQRTVATTVKLPEGSYLEWSGQFEHQVRAKRTLRIVFPAVILVIFIILYMTYNDVMHALLMMMAVPGALAGGVIFQTLFGFNFSVAVWVGYIACFGMATETGIIMLVYLRDAIAERGGLAQIPSLEDLEAAIMSGAVHRLRPKLLTEGTAIVGLAPMLWASGVGAEVMAPMAAPVLGGLLIADEVIDIFLPVLFYQVEASRWKKIHLQPAVADVATPVMELVERGNA